MRSLDECLRASFVLLIAAVIWGVLWWLYTKIPESWEPFKFVFKWALYIAAAALCIAFFAGFIGYSHFPWGY